MSSMISSADPTVLRLRREWLVLAFISGLATTVGFVILQVLWRPDYALRWLILSSALVIYLLSSVWHNLGLNHRMGERGLLPSIGVGSMTTFLRGLLLAFLVGFLFSPAPDGSLGWAPALAYLSATLLDYLDGYLARAKNQVTPLGGLLDMRLDGLGVLAAAAIAVQYGRVPIWYLIIGFSRYLFLFGIWLRKRTGRTVFSLSPSVRRRAFAGAQMGFLAVMLMPVFSPPATHVAANAFMFPFLLGFAWDWLSVSGRSMQRWQLRADELKAVAVPVVSLLARVASVVLLAYCLSQLYLTDPDRVRLLALDHLLRQPDEAAIFIAAKISLMILFVFGVAGRLTALTTLIMLGFLLRMEPLSYVQILLIWSITAVFFLGTGPRSLWEPENRLIYSHAGEAT